MEREKKQEAEFDVNPSTWLRTGKVLGILSYIWILCFIPLLLKRKDEFIHHHAKQGLALFIFEIALSVVAVVPLLGWLLSFFGWILAVILSLLGILNVLAGKKWEMPVLGKYADRLKF